MMDRLELEQTLHRQIPLTRAIGIAVSQLDDHSITLTAPLQNNLNHKATAFGGSLYSVAVLTGWGLLSSRLEALGLHGQIVIQDSNIRYLLPVTQDISAHCSLDKPDEFERFLTRLQKKGRSKIRLESRISIDGRTAVEFSGSYAVLT